MGNHHPHLTKPEMGKCRFCTTPLEHTFVDLGMSPLCENFLSDEDIHRMEAFYPLKVFVCHSCFLVQLEEFVSPQDIYKDYNYYSSYSDSWLKHAEDFVNFTIRKFHLSSTSFVAEIASNDGYLLYNFLKHKIPILGIEPAAAVADCARGKGVQTESVFFWRGCRTKAESKLWTS